MAPPSHSDGDSSIHRRLPATSVPSAKEEQSLEDALQSVSRHNSVNSLWSSADVPLFFDAPKAHDHTALASSPLPAHRDSIKSDSSASSSRRSGEKVPLTAALVMPQCRAASSHFVNPWDRTSRSVPNGPESPTISRASSVSSEALKASTPSSSLQDQIGEDEQLHIIEHPLNDILQAHPTSSQGLPRGFKLKKPAALQVTPIAFSSPLGKPPMSTTPTSHPLSAGEVSTLAPSLGPSPTRSQDTQHSTDLDTPLTEKSLTSRHTRYSKSAVAPGTPHVVGRTPALPSSDKYQHGSLYSRAQQFFNIDYSMSNPSLGAQNSTSMGTSSDGRFPPSSADSPRMEQMLPTVSEVHASDSTSTISRQPLDTFTALRLSTSSTRSQIDSRRPSRDSSHRNRNLYPPRASSVTPQPNDLAASQPLPKGTQRPSLSRESHDEISPPRPPSFSMARPESAGLDIHSSPVSPKTSLARALGYGDVKPRIRALSVPKLNRSGHGQAESSNSARKGSLSVVGASGLVSPPSSSRNSLSPAMRLLQLRHNIDPGFHANYLPTSSSTSVLLQKQPDESRLGPPLYSDRSPRSRQNSAVSLPISQTMNKSLPRSPSRPDSKGDWSSYLSEGLTLYIDQGGFREVAIKIPYLSYDPFGHAESLAGSAPMQSALKRLGRRPSSSGKGAQSNAIGLLEFARSDISGPLAAAYFSTTHSTPILRHLGIGDDTKADLLTRQAALSLERDGVHQVSGNERSGKVGWRLSYEVGSIDRGGQVPEKVLRPISFVCSATLLDPARARKGRFLKMVKKGVATNIASSLVQGSEPSTPTLLTAGDVRRGSVRSSSPFVLSGSHPSPTRSPFESSQRHGSVDSGQIAAPSLGQVREYSLPPLPGQPISPVRRLDPARTAIPPNLPAGVIPFQLRSPGDVKSSTRTSSKVPPSPSRDRNLLEQNQLRRTSQTAAEEIKLAYLRSSQEKEQSAASVQVGNTAATGSSSSRSSRTPVRRGDARESTTNGSGPTLPLSSSGSGSMAGSSTWSRLLKGGGSRGDSPGCSSPSPTRHSPLHQHFEARESRPTIATENNESDSSAMSFNANRYQTQHYHHQTTRASTSGRSHARGALSSKTLPRTPREDLGLGGAGAHRREDWLEVLPLP